MFIDAIPISYAKFNSNTETHQKNINEQDNATPRVINPIHNSKLLAKTLPLNKESNITIQLKSNKSTSNNSLNKIDHENIESDIINEDKVPLILANSKSYSTQADSSEYNSSRSEKEGLVNNMHKTMSQSNSDANITVKGRTHLSIPGLKRELRHSTSKLNERDRIIRKACSNGYESDDADDTVIKRKPRVDSNLSYADLDRKYNKKSVKALPDVEE